MSDQPQGARAQPADSHRGLRLLGLVAVSAGVLLLMAAAFVLSYTGIHALALSAGVSPRFARIYPVIFDAMLVVACAAVLALRGAGLPSRCYAWLTMLLLLAAAAGADTVHATNTRLPHKPAAAAAAIIPWALVLLGFGLLLSMLRHARLRRAMLAAAPERAFTQPSGHVEVRQHPGLDDLFSSKHAADAPAVRYVPPTRPLPPADAALDLAIESDPGQDDPSSDEGHPAARAGERHEQPAGYRGNSASAFSPAPTIEIAKDARTPAATGAKRRTEAGTVPVPRPAPSLSPEAKPARDAKPAPDAKPLADPRPVADPKPAADAKPAGDTKPTAVGSPKASAKAQPASEAKPVPAARRAAQTPAAEPAPEAKPISEAEPATAATAEAGPAPETGPKSDPEATAGPEGTDQAEASAQPEDTPDADTVPGAEDAPAVPLQFDRVRSSPVPPEA
jgi:Protein of unknown function (DUF2637)